MRVFFFYIVLLQDKASTLTFLWILQENSFQYSNLIFIIINDTKKYGELTHL